MKIIKKIFEGENSIPDFHWVSELTEKEQKDFDLTMEKIYEDEISDIPKQIELNRLILKYNDDALDAYNYYCHLLHDNDEKLDLLVPVVNLILKKLQSAGFNKNCLMSYDFLNNRPVWRLLYNYAFCRSKQRTSPTSIKESIRITSLLLSSNPNDNMGFRYMLAWNYIRVNKLDKALDIVKKYNTSGYCDEELLYAGALISIKMKDKNSFESYLRRAMRQKPLYAQLIIQNTRVMAKYAFMDDMNYKYGHGLAVGSLDEAINWYFKSFDLWEPHLSASNNQNDRLSIYDCIRKNLVPEVTMDNE